MPATIATDLQQYIPNADPTKSPEHVFVITADATNELPWVTSAVRAEGAGSITAVTQGGETVTLYFKDGETRRVRLRKVTAIATITHLEGMA